MILACAFMIILSAATNLNADFNIPAGSTFNLNSGTLNVTGDLDIDGTLVVTTGTITLTGDFDNAGTFTGGTGTVSFTGTSQTIIGSNTFYNLTKVTGGGTLIFPAGVETFVDGLITLQGTGAATRLTLNSSDGATQFDLNLDATTGTQSMNYLDVSNSDATARDLIAINSVGALQGNDDLDASPHWIFGATSVTWEGDVSTDWEDGNNWDIGLVPTSADEAIIPNGICGGCVYPTFTANVTVDILTVASSATVTLAGFNLTITDESNLTLSGILSNEGVIIAQGTETLTFDTTDTNSGTFRFVGTNSGVTRTIPDFGAIDYYNLVINDVNGTPDIFVLSTDLTVANNLNVTSGALNPGASGYGRTITTTGTLTVDGGTFNATSANIDANGSVVVSSGTLSAPEGALSFTVASNWTFSGGTFNHSDGIVTFDSTGAAVITGGTTFYDFVSSTGGKAFTFADGSTQLVNHAFDFNGQDGNLITLNVVGGGTDWNIQSNFGALSVTYLNVSNSNVVGVTGHDINCTNCTGVGQGNDDAGASPHWIFVNQLSGTVFETIENFTIQDASIAIYRSSDDALAVPGTDLHSKDNNPYLSQDDGSYQFRPVAANYYIRITAEGFTYPTSVSQFPSGRTIIAGSQAETFTKSTGATTMDQPIDFTSILIRIEKDANKSEVQIGGIVTYTVEMENISSLTLRNVILSDTIPAGFKYLKNRALIDGIPLIDPEGNRPLLFSVGDFDPGTKKTLRYQLVVGSGVTTGDYKNTALARYPTGQRLSNIATETVEIVLDPLFDLGTVIGKVFYDHNGNGIQDPPEYYHLDRETIFEDPVPNVKIVMEDGTIITTDHQGKFNIPALAPGRHLFRLDERTLPEGAILTTDKTVILNITPGLFSKVNFGVSLDYSKITSDDQQFFTNKIQVLQDTDRAEVRLNVSLFQKEIVAYSGVFVDKAEFRIFTNYAAFIENWKLEIFDKDTKKVIRSFNGNRFNIHDPILWDGKDDFGQYIKLDQRNYEYIVTVVDRNEKYDETSAQDITIVNIEEEFDLNKYLEEHKVDDKEYKAWLKKEATNNKVNVQTILVDGETVTIDSLSTSIRSVRIVKDGVIVTELPVIERRELTAKDLIDGVKSQESIPLEIILPRGDYEILVQETDGVAGAIVSEDGIDRGLTLDKRVVQDYGLPLKTYSKKVSIGEDRLFFVALGDAEMGYTINRGNVEPIDTNDKYKGGFYSEGKFAYYLQGKIKGKYLITSSFDNEREQKELFRNLDEDDYYPIYGDSSTIDYKATDTQGNLYLLVEWDKSKVLWGNYEVGFGDTEFAQYSRTLYGGKIDFESLATTKYGDARTKAIVFRARAQQKSAHNEFLATGGSLYYFKHKDLIQGSDKIKIEVRDKITGLVISEREMVEGADYDMDYDSGRMIFWRPVPVLVDSYSIISSDLLDGNLVYVVADYEYDLKDKYDEDSVGARIRQAVTDNVLVGGTYVQDAQDDDRYSLTGTDITVKLGEDATIVAEYAESESEIQGTFLSTDGGLSFTELATADDAQGRAYGIKGDARLFNRLGIGTYYKWVDNDFSSSATTAQQGKEQIGFELTYDISDKTRLTARHDIQNLLDDGNLQTEAQVGANKTATTLIQIVHEAKKLRLTGEYQRNEVTERKDKFISKTNIQKDIIAIRADYEVSNKLGLSLQQQFSVTGTDSNQTTMGAKYKPSDKVTLTVEEIISDKGVATKFGATADMNEKLSVSGVYAIVADKSGGLKNLGSIGATAKVTDQLQVKTSIGVTETGVERSTEVAVGGSSKISDKTTVDSDVVLSRDKDGKVTRTVAVGGSSEIDDDTSLTSRVELSESDKGKSTTLVFGGKSKVDDKTTQESSVSITESGSDGKTTAFIFGSKTKISDEIELVSARTFGTSDSGNQTQESSYGLSRVKDGRKLEGTLTRKYAEGKENITKSNIFGLTGDVNDRLALTGSVEKANIQNLDGTQTDRTAIALGAGYVKRDEVTGETLQSSTKIEVRLDEGETDARQYLIYNTIEGKINPEISVFTKVEFSKSLNLSGDSTDAEYKEMVIGGAYRPIQFDRLNVLARYTYLQDKSPVDQKDSADIEAEQTQVFSGEAIYDLSEHWQLSEKVAYRIAEEKVAGFDFNKTHTWLMIHRLNYKIDRDWTFGAEYRMLTVREAQDVKQGILVEAARRLGEYAQLGLGYNLTDFNDNLTQLNYTSQGPFVRLTGKFYDRTPEEIERARQLWIDEKVQRWAWFMVNEELSRDDSPILYELNDYFRIADKAHRDGQFEESRHIYKDIIMAGQMMFEEAAEFIHKQIDLEEQLEEMRKLADQYYKDGEYDKAKKILEKILDEANKRMLE